MSREKNNVNPTDQSDGSGTDYGTFQARLLICCGTQAWESPDVPNVYYCGRCGKMYKLTNIQADDIKERFDRRIEQEISILKGDAACDFIQGKTVFSLFEDGENGK